MIHADSVWPSGVMNVNDSSSAYRTMTPVESLTGEPGHGRDVEQGDLAGRDARERGVEPLRPSARTSGTAPSRSRSTSCGRHVDAVERTRNVFCQSWPKPCSGPGHALAGDGVDLGAGDAGRRQAVDGLGPIGGVARLVAGVLGGVRSWSVSSVQSSLAVRPPRPRWPPLRRRGSRSPRRAGSAPGSGGSGRTGPVASRRTPPRWARTRSVTSKPMPPLFMYSSRLKSRMTAVAPSSTARRVSGHELGLAARRDVAGDAQDRDGAAAIEPDDGRGHAASPSTISMKSDRRVIRKISR